MGEPLTPAFPPGWETFPGEFQRQHAQDVYERILEHRYRYYIKDEAVISDGEYDYLERYCKVIWDAVGLVCPLFEMVDFKMTHPACAAAARRVELGMDSYNEWLEEMKPTWERVGMPKKSVESKDAEVEEGHA